MALFLGMLTSIDAEYYPGRSQDFREGGAEVCICEAGVQILAAPTYEIERSKFKLSQRTRSERS